MIRLQRILVLIDFSKNSEKAVHYGAELARNLGAKVFLLHVIPQDIIDAIQELSKKAYKGDFLHALRRLISDRERELRKFIPEAWGEGIDVEFWIRRGEPAEEVIKSAKEFSIDLIVLGSQGQGATPNSTIGHVTHRVVNEAPCPVLLVRLIEHDFIE